MSPILMSMPWADGGSRRIAAPPAVMSGSRRPRCHPLRVNGVRRAFSWAKDQVDALVALALGITFSVLGLLNVVEGDVIAEATLGVLTLVAFTILRERNSRRSFVAKIEESVSSLRSGTPYRIMKYDVAWDLRTREMAYCRKVKTLRFLHDNVISLWDYALADGAIDNVTYSPGRKVDTFAEGNRTFDLISLGRRHQVGDPDLDFVVERQVSDSFSEAQETIIVDVVDPTDLLAFKVTWPPDLPPRNARLEITSGPERTSRDIDPSEFQEVDGRKCFSRTIEQPPQGDEIRLIWDW